MLKIPIVKLKESKKRDKYLDLARELKVTVISIVIGSLCTVPKGRASGDHQDCSIDEIGLNTEKSPGDLRRLAETQTPVKKNIS